MLTNYSLIEYYYSLSALREVGGRGENKEKSGFILQENVQSFNENSSLGQLKTSLRCRFIESAAVGALDRKIMLAERPKIDSAIKSLSLDVHEIAAGKLCALLSRQTGRDLFDAHQLLIGPNAVLKKEGVSQRLD